MAEDNNQDNEKKSPIKLILMIVGGIVLLGAGLGIGILMGGGESSDPSTEISQIIEKKENPEASEKNTEEEIEEVAAECAEEEKDEEGNCPVGPKKIPKITPEEEIFATTYYEFPGNFTTNLKESKKFLQISLGVSSHQLALRSEILTIMSTFSPADIAGREGKQKLADSLKEGINNTLVKVEGFGGVENVHFTSFVLQ